MYKLRNNGYNLISLLFLLFITLLVFNFEYVLTYIKPSFSFGEVVLEKQYNLKIDNFNNDQTVYSFNENFLQITSDELIYIEDYQPKWSKKLNGEKVRIYPLKDYFYLVDISLGEIFKVDKNGNIIAKKYSLGQIKKIFHYNKNEVYVLTQMNEVICLNSSLEVEFQKDLALEHLLGIKFYQGRFYLMNLETKSDAYLTRIAVFSKTFDFISNINLNNNIYYDLKFQKEESIFFGTKNILALDYDNNKKWQVGFDHLIENYSYTRNYIFVNEKSEKETLDENDPNYINVLKKIDSNGVTVKTIEAPLSNIKGMFYKSDKLYLYNSNEICVLDSNLTMLLIKKMEEKINEVDVINDQLLIKTMDEVIIYKEKMKADLF